MITIKLRLTDDYQYPSEEEQEEKQKEKQEEKQKEEQEEKQETISDVNEFNKWINKKETSINTELFTKHFNFQRPSNMFNFLNNINDIKKNSELVDVIISGLKDLKNEIKDMSKEERENEKPDTIVEIVEDILGFNKNKKQKTRKTKHKNTNTKPNA